MRNNSEPSHFRTFVLSCLLFVPTLLSAQDSLFVREIIKELSSPEMHGRSVAYEGDRKAAEYIRKVLTDLEIQSMGENYFQAYSFPGFAMEGKVSLAINNEQLLDPQEDYRIYPCSPSFDQQNVPILQADPMILLDVAKRDKFIKKHADALPHSLLYFDLTKVKAKDMRSMKSLLEMATTRLWIARNSAPFHCKGFLVGVAELPVIGLSMTNYERNFVYVEVMASKISKSAKTVTLSYQNRFLHHKTQNVCGMVEGTLYPDSFLVFTAHYDHIGRMGDDVYFPGAHDNASGVATVLSLAHYFQRNRNPYTTVFCLFSGEEGGLRGANYFVENPLISLDNIKMLVNFDMLCGGDDGLMMVNSREGRPKQFYDEIVAINEKEQIVKEIKSRANTSNSDHFPFTEKGVPALFVYTMGGQTGGYHSHTDTNENCGLSQWESIFKLVTHWIEQLTNVK